MKLKKKTKRIIAIIVLVLIIITAVLGISISVFAKDNKTGYVYIGDSRFVQLDNYFNIDEKSDTFLIAKVGVGYNWWTKTGKYELENIRSNNEYDDWVYIFNLGINDLGNINKYTALIPELEQEATVYVLAINPVIDSKTQVQNKDIEPFNEEIRQASEHYLDSYTYLQTVGYDANDGLHYDFNTCEDIYDFMSTSVDLNEFLRQQPIESTYLNYMIAQPNF